jgi:hypothetical protein
MTENLCILGIDLSLTSPGISVYEECSKQWYLYAFSPCVLKFRDFDHKFVQLLPKIPEPKKACDPERFKFVVDNVIEIIRMWKDKYPKLIVGQENYAFGKDTGNGFKLIELGGLLKYRMYYDLNIIPRLLPPKRWKSIAINNGNASKLETALFMRKIMEIDLFSLFHLCEGDIKLDAKEFHPVDDLCDSAGIAYALYILITKPEIEEKIKQGDLKVVAKKRKKREKNKKSKEYMKQAIMPDAFD